MSERLEPSQDAIARFVDLLFRYADPDSFVSLRAFDQFERGTPAVLVEGVQVGEDMAGVVDRAVRAAGNTANRPQAIVFCPPVATFLGPRKASMDEMANGVALSVEMDTGNPARALSQLAFLIGPPTVVVASGGEWVDPDTGEVFQKQHFHWRLTEPTRGEAEHRRLQAAREMAAALVGADPTAAPPCHPLRWPGSWNRKKDRPRLAEILAADDGAEIDLQEVYSRLEEAVEAAGLRGAGDVPKASGEPQAPIANIVSALAVIPNEDLHWDDWTKMGLAVWRATGGSVEGLNAWADWSAKSRKHEDQDCVDRWKHFATSPPTKIGAGTIFFRAKALGWQHPGRARAEPVGMDEREIPPHDEGDVLDVREPVLEPSFRGAPRGGEARAGRGRQAERGEIEWQSPIDFLAEDDLTGAAELRREHVPEALWGFVIDTAERMGVDPASVALTAIVTCAAVVTDDWKVQVKKFDTEWTEPPRVWGGTVGKPSVKKSPVLKACTSPVDALEARARETYEEALVRYKVQHKAWKDDKTASPADEPRKPRAVRFLVEGTTVEALSEVLRTDSEARFNAPAKKVLVRADELAELIGSFDRYKSGGSGGGDRGAYLRLYNGGRFMIDRVNRGSFPIPNWSACLVGGIQPDVFKAIVTDAKEDGLMQRFMFCVPGDSTRGVDRAPDTMALSRYDDLIRSLTTLTPGGRSFGDPGLGAKLPPVVLHQDAHQHREGIEDLMQALSSLPDTPGRLVAAYGKWSGLFARLALVFHLIEAADVTSRTGTRPPTQILSEATAKMAAAYMEDILLPHLLRADALMYRTIQASHASWIAKFILAQGKPRITTRDITRAYGALRPPEKRRELGDVMEGLVTMAWVARVAPGAPAWEQTAWLVNPLVLERFRARGEAERERRAEVRTQVRELLEKRRKGKA